MPDELGGASCGSAGRRRLRVKQPSRRGDDNLDTLLAAYTGDAVNALTKVASNDDACTFGSSITFTAIEAETYRIAVDGVDGETSSQPPAAARTARRRLRRRRGHQRQRIGRRDERWSVARSIGARRCLEFGLVPVDGTVDRASHLHDVRQPLRYGDRRLHRAVARVTGFRHVQRRCLRRRRKRREVRRDLRHDVQRRRWWVLWSVRRLHPQLEPEPTAAVPDDLSVDRRRRTRRPDAGRARRDSRSGSPTFAYAWGRCDASFDACDLIPGATGQTYMVSTRDIGNRLFLQVTGTNVSGSTTEYSDVTAIVRPGGPANTSLPEVIGRAAVGEFIDSTTGNWTGAQPITYAYQWQLCNSAGSDCRDIAGAQAASIRLEAGHVGGTLRVVVRASNADGARAAASNPTGVVVARRTQMRRCVVPKLRGKTLRAARTAIRRGSCRMGRVQRRFSNRVKAGRVVAQRPRAGARLAVNARVHLVVSKGKRR